MKRTRLERRTPLARGPMKRTKRKPSETRRIYGTPERIAWLKSQPCLVMGCGRGPCEVAHTTTGGTGRKADACHTVSLCPTHHRELHAIGVRTWEAMHLMDLGAAAILTEKRWQHHQAQPVKLSAIIPGVVRAIVEEGEC